MKYLILHEEYAELAIMPVLSKQMAKIRMYSIHNDTHETQKTHLKSRYQQHFFFDK